MSIRNRFIGYWGIDDWFIKIFGYGICFTRGKLRWLKPAPKAGFTGWEKWVFNFDDWAHKKGYDFPPFTWICNLWDAHLTRGFDK